jgi:hypothetical protein
MRSVGDPTGSHRGAAITSWPKLLGVGHDGSFGVGHNSLLSMTAWPGHRRYGCRSGPSG